MKLYIRLALLALLAPLCLAAVPVMAQDTIKIAAVVNDEPISVLDLQARIRVALVSSGMPDTPENRSRVSQQVLRSLIDEKLKLQEAKKQDITVDDSEIDDALKRIAQQNNVPMDHFDEFLKRIGISRATLSDQIHASIAWSKLVRRKLGSSVQISDEQVDEVAARIKDAKGKNSYRVADIFLAVENQGQDDEVRQQAQRLLDQIRAGADFSAVAVQNSQSASAATGGDIGWVQAGQLEPEIDQALSGMSSGQLGGPIRTFGGYHVILLRDRKNAGTESASDDMVVGLRQAFIAIPSNAPSAQVKMVQGRAKAATQNLHGCDQMDAMLNKAAPGSSGDVGKVRVGDLPEAVRPIAASLPIGQPSEPIRLDRGIGVIMVCTREEGKGPNRDDIEESLKRERLDMLARRYLRDLRRTAFVDIRV